MNFLKRNKSNLHYDVVIVGGGPAAFYCSYYLDQNIKVLIIDRNEQMLKKFRLTGAGFANITNMCTFSTLLDNMIYGTKKFMYHAFKHNDRHDILTLLDQLHIGYEQRSNNALKEPDTFKIHLLESNEKVIHKFLNLLHQRPNITIHNNENVTAITKDDQGFTIQTNHSVYTCQYVVLATGGLSYQQFSKNDNSGYQLAQSLNHSITGLYPMGVMLNLSSQLKQFQHLEGSALKACVANVYFKNKSICQEENDLMITKKGIGGPLVRRISGYVTYHHLMHQPLKITLDLYNDKNYFVSQLQTAPRLGKFFDSLKIYSKAFIKNVYENLEMNALTDLKNLSKENKQKIINYFFDIDLQFALPVSFQNQDFAAAINTGGGVDTKAIDPTTFMSKIHQNLFFIGEMLDVNAKSGGFNLTVCYASGRQCAKTINQFTHNFKKDNETFE